jgi:hypothetical protein
MRLLDVIVSRKMNADEKIQSLENDFEKKERSQP